MTQATLAPDTEKNTEGTVFGGTPRAYLRLSILGSFFIHAYLLGGYWLIRNLWVGQPWPETFWPPVLTLASALFFSRFAYRWIMRLDAQYGSGGGWEMETITVKLPREKPRRR